MSKLGKANKRPDVYAVRNQRERELYRLRQLNRSSIYEGGSETDRWGRFVGHGDIARGLEYFNSRRLAAEEVTK